MSEHGSEAREGHWKIIFDPPITMQNGDRLQVSYEDGMPTRVVRIDAQDELHELKFRTQRTDYDEHGYYR